MPTARGCRPRSSGMTGARSPPRRPARRGIPGGSWSSALSGGRHAVIAFSLDGLDSTVTRLEIADALAGAIAIVVLAGIGLPLVRASLAPLARIEATAAAIAGGDLSQRIDHPSRSTEVGRLADALDTMLGRIEAAYRARADGEAHALRSEDRMRRFVADASHELRTPLTSVRGLAEYGLQQGDAASPDELLRLMTLIGTRPSRMGRLVEDLLMLARFDAGRPLDRRPVDLASIAAEAVQAGPHRQPGPPVTLQAADPVIVYADEERLRQVIDNLIGNAIQHTPPRSPVTVAVTGTAGTGQLTVADKGPGMTRGAGRARVRALLPDRRRPDPRPRRHRARPGHRRVAGRRPRRRDHRGHRSPARALSSASACRWRPPGGRDGGT